jgi:hypothetical protein
MTDGADSFGGDMRIESAAKSGQVEVSVNAAELLSGFGHTGGAPAGDVLAFLARKSEGEWAGLYTRRSAAEPGWGVG